MQWTPGGKSGDIEDRRTESGSRIRGTHLGVGGTLVLLVLSLIFGHDFVSLFSGHGRTVNQASRTAVQDPAEAELVQFVSFVLDDLQKTWDRLLPQQSGVPYRHAKLVLFRDATDSSCGLAQSATGPFYCPVDEKVYIDLGFYDELKNRFGAPANLAKRTCSRTKLGTTPKNCWASPKVKRSNRVARRRRILYPLSRVPGRCLAGIWANSTAQRIL